MIKMNILVLSLLVISTSQPSQLSFHLSFHQQTELENWMNKFVPGRLNKAADTCYRKTLDLFKFNSTRKRFEEYFKVMDVNAEKNSSDSTCPFHFDYTNPNHWKFGSTHMTWNSEGIDLEKVTWSCDLNPNLFCDGLSQCQTDECHCQNLNKSDVFYCADDSGCIAWSNLCDGIQDCSDGSDECFCADFIVMNFPILETKLCISERFYCFNRVLIDSVESENILVKGNQKCNDQTNPIYKCLTEAYSVFISNNWYRNQPGAVAEYCRVNCSNFEGFDDGWASFCGHIVEGYHPGTDFDFRCSLLDWTERFHLTTLCDGQIDCGNHADEIGCPGRFYCNPNVTSDWIDPVKVCDNVKDCINGTDECGTCQFEALSSSEFLIHSKIVLIGTTIMGILIISVNLIQGYKCYYKTCASRVKVIDRIFLLQIFFHDMLMGVYLCCIVVAAIILNVKGEYCQLEDEWRASPFCSAFGVVFSFSSHGSLLAIASISITRFLTCHNLLLDINKTAVVIASFSNSCINLLHACLPLLPLTAVQDIFRTDIFFTNLDKNPFFSTNPINMSHLARVHEGLVHEEGKDVYNMITDLVNVTSKKEIFDIMEIGYYGNTGLCIHNIFKSQDSYELYKILYCVVIILLLSIVTTTYLMIILKQRKSNKALASNAATVDQHDCGSITNTLTLKVALMIGSQLLCWISFIMTVLYFQYIVQKPPSPKVFEVFALVVIPINSFLNPVFYSELYKKVVQAMWVKWRQFVDFVQSKQTAACQDAEIE